MSQQRLTAFTDAGESNLSEQEECPTCGRGFDSEMGVKVHHVNAHREHRHRRNGLWKLREVD
jgi:hypothetical protein